MTPLQPVYATLALRYIMPLLEKAFLFKCLNKPKDHKEQKLLLIFPHLFIMKIGVRSPEEVLSSYFKYFSLV